MAERILTIDALSAGEVPGNPGDSVTDPETEQRLLEGLREGEESAYETLIVRYEQPVYNLVCRLLNDPSEACDVVQEVFLKVFRKVRSFRGESCLKTWVYRIAVNEAHNHCRWRGRHRRQEVRLEGAEAEGRCYRDTIPADGASPYEYVLGQEERALVEQALAGLNPSFRAVVVLRDIEDMSYEDIAEVLRIPLGTVKSRILRGREALRAGVEQRLATGPAFDWTPQTVE